MRRLSPIRGLSLLPLALFAFGCVGTPEPENAVISPLFSAKSECNPLNVALSKITLQDSLIKDPTGQLMYRTAHDGVVRPLLKANPRLVTKTTASNSLHVMNESTTDPAPLLPQCVMLSEKGFMTPVKDQGDRPTCTIFASVAVIESEYLRDYGKPLDLSEQYILNMMNEMRTPDWAGGAPAEKISMAAAYGVPLEKQWPYVSTDKTWQNRISRTLHSSLAYDDLSALIWDSQFLKDLTNFSNRIYPSVVAHRGAFYGPQIGALTQINNDGVNVEPFEKVLADGHAIAFATVVGRWKTNPSTGIIEYDESGDDSGGHSITLVGFNHSLRFFRIKNSWGDQWNGNGYADFSYDLFLKTASDASYITSVKDPDAPQAGAGLWRGFWTIPATDSSPSAVAVIHHTFNPEAPEFAGLTSTTPDAMQIFRQDGVITSYPQFVSGDANAVTFSSPENTFNLTIAENGLSATYTNSADGSTATWRRCNPGDGQNLTPRNYLQASEDPEVLPACNVRLHPIGPAGTTTPVLFSNP